MREVAFSDLPSLAGQEIGHSEWTIVSQERINQFAEATGDHQWIHVDIERANKEMGTTIAHGFLTLSLLPMLAAQIMRTTGVSRGINYGLNKLRFTGMVPSGARVRLKEKMLSVEPKGDGLQLTRECTVEIESQDRPALVAEWVTVVYP
ncbi:MAG: MaoC family dehydratase [Alphaproteobacteria bacterium]|jgi:acyl dehydratase|nr:MaoC family dehydratase [Alphaproteobacteria bacterium]